MHRGAALMWAIAPVRCPVDGCEWSTELDPPLAERPTVQATREASDLMWRRLEDQLWEHSLHHSPMEYLRTIQRLRSDLGRTPSCPCDRVT